MAPRGAIAAQVFSAIMMLVGYTERLGCLTPAFGSVLEAASEPDPDAGRYPWRRVITSGRN